MLNSLRDVLNESIQDLYSAETQLLKALPRMAKAASEPQLKEAFTAHLEQTRNQATRLEKACEHLGIKAKGKTCAAMKGLLEEGAEVIAEKGAAAAKDAAMIVAAQKVEHYEIAGYGAACTFAKILGEEEVAGLLTETLAEEKAADEKLNEIAESTVNDEANSEEQDTEEDTEAGDDDAAEEDDDEGEEDEDEAVAPKRKGEVPAKKSVSKPGTNKR